jgi:hypothetical protein
MTRLLRVCRPFMYCRCLALLARKKCGTMGYSWSVLYTSSSKSGSGSGSGTKSSRCHASNDTDSHSSGVLGHWSVWPQPILSTAEKQWREKDNRVGWYGSKGKRWQICPDARTEYISCTVAGRDALLVSLIFLKWPVSSSFTFHQTILRLIWLFNGKLLISFACSHSSIWSISNVQNAFPHTFVHFLNHEHGRVNPR